MTVETQQVELIRSNIYAYFGDKKDAKVLLTSHIDTVPPFLPYHTQGDIIYGRGSVDAKASVATQIISSLQLYRDGIIKDGDVALLFVVGEEVTGDGMIYASQHLEANWDHAIFGEPTEGKLGVGHKGIYGGTIEVEGKGAHSGYPDLGIDANSKLIDLLYKILKLEFPIDELLGNTTVNPGIIKAGLATNVISPIAKSSIYFRTAKDTWNVRNQILQLIEEESQKYHNIKISETRFFEPVYLNHTVPGFDTLVVAYGTDIAGFTKEVQSRYLYGPGSILVAHSANEFITISELEEAVTGYKNLTKFLLNN